MSFYYISNQIYQFLYSEPVYRELGGTFLTWKYRTYLRLKKQFFLNRLKNPQDPYPPIRHVNRYNITGDDGVLIANSLHRIGYDRTRHKLILMYHGTSDKIPRVSAQVAGQFDYYFLTGPKNEQKLAGAAGINWDSERLIRTGNWMFDSIVNNNYDVDEIRRKYDITDTSRPTVLYAPTWSYGGGTLFNNFENFITTIPEQYNLIIRPHYAERKYIPKLARMVPAKFKQRVSFVNSANIFKYHFMENLFIADLLLSDTSSMVYEYLIMRRPLIICATESPEVSQNDYGTNIADQVDKYRPGDDVMKMIKKNLDDKSIRNDMDKLLHHFFYFNDGKSTQRCIDFLKTVS
ncbi:MAG: CDP-glycerol glycerophosphotransferase family protein [Candidatus Neomarinimicrobiota bacterium]